MLSTVACCVLIDVFSIVSLARAVYSRASTLFLDDVLSAGTLMLQLEPVLARAHLLSQWTLTPHATCTINASRVT